MGGKGSGRKPNLPAYDPEDGDAGNLPQLCLSQEEHAGLAMFHNCPPKVQAVLVLKAIGHNQTTIGKMLGITKQAVQGRLSKYDPEGVFALSPATIQKYRAAMHSSLADRALAAVSDKKIEDSSAYQLTMISAVNRDKAAKIMETVTPPQDAGGATKGITALVSPVAALPPSSA